MTYTISSGKSFVQQFKCCLCSTKKELRLPGWGRQKLPQLLSTRCCLAVEAALKPGQKRHEHFFVKRIYFNSPVHWPQRWQRWCRPPLRGVMSCPCTVRAPPPSCERTAEKIRAWTRYPTSRSRTSSRRCPCRCPPGTSGFAPSLCPKDIQPTLQPLLRQDLFFILTFCICTCSIKCAYLPYNLPQIQEPLLMLGISLFCCWFVSSLQG